MQARNRMMGKPADIIEVSKPIKEIEKEPLKLGIEQRLLEEVKAAVFLAKQFPRDEVAAEKRILDLCKRKKFADTALYSFPRGKELVEGFTIRFAEAVARTWGNIQYSVIELETQSGVAKMVAYAWDVENNIKTTRQFDVEMIRYTQYGSFNLENFRDRYEMKASYAARFLRGCLLNLIPHDILETAIEQVKKTMSEENEGLSLEERKALTLEFMNNRLGLSKADLEEIISSKYENWNANHLTNLKLIYNGIKEGQLKISDFQKINRTANITDEQIAELIKLDKKKVLVLECQRRFKKNILGQLTNKEYEEMKDFLSSKLS